MFPNGDNYTVGLQCIDAAACTAAMTDMQEAGMSGLEGCDVMSSPGERGLNWLVEGPGGAGCYSE